MSPICDNSNDACDILNQPTESIPFKIPMRIVEKIMDERYAGDGTVHPSDHLLKFKELCELFKVAGLSRENVMNKLFPLSLKDKAKEWYVKGICPRGNNKVVIILFQVYDKCLFLML